MTKWIPSRILLLTLTCAMLSAPVAWGWGTRAQRSLTVMAMHVLKEHHPNAFKSEETNFERDVLTGCTDGHAALNRTVLLNSDRESVLAVGTEIQLLRHVKQYGMGSYFAYRMGVLSSLVADVMLPFGFTWSEQEQAIQKQIEKDIEGHLDAYGYSVRQRHREYIRDARNYFEKRRAFYAEDKRIIKNDYLTGVGYQGFLNEAGPAYFVHSVEAVADAWHTVLRRQGDPSDNMPSKRLLTWYFVDEIDYLLTVKHNLRQADKVYRHFEAVNPEMPQAYERLGDLYYAFDSEESRMRGVHEWSKAHSLGGPERPRIAAKLAEHYIEEGQKHLEEASRPGAPDDALPNALHAFETALDLDRTNDEAASLIQETHVRIRERKERYEMVLSIIATGEKVQEEAEKARLNGDFGNALRTYRQAISFFEAVDDEFRDQYDYAKETIRSLKKSITDVINEVLDRASDAIDDGERAKEEHKYEEAIASYQKVWGIVNVIPDDENPDLVEEKNDIIALAERTIEEAKVPRIRYEEAKAEQGRAARERAGNR